MLVTMKIVIETPLQDSGSGGLKFEKDELGQRPPSVGEETAARITVDPGRSQFQPLHGIRHGDAACDCSY
jgi:hypothetical protein